MSHYRTAIKILKLANKGLSTRQLNERKTIATHTMIDIDEPKRLIFETFFSSI